MLTVQEFVQNISEVFKKVFPEVSIENSFIRLGTGLTHVELQSIACIKNTRLRILKA